MTPREASPDGDASFRTAGSAGKGVSPGETEPDRAPWLPRIRLKEIPFLGLLVLCGAVIGVVCHSVSQRYEEMFFPFSQALRSAAWTLAALLLVATLISLVTILVRRMRSLMAGHALGALALGLGWRGGCVSAAGSAIYLVGMALYSRVLTEELNQRLGFSLRPILYEQRKLFLVFSLLLSISFAWGYQQAEHQNSLEIPENYRRAMEDILLARLKAQVEYQPGLTDEQRAGLLAEAGRGVDDLINRIEATVQPYLQFIPLGLILPLLLLLQSLLASLGWIPILLLGLIIPLLRALKITRVEAETKEQRTLGL